MWPFRRADPKPRFPEGRVGYAVGDVHGRADLLARALRYIEDQALAVGPNPIVVVFLGDYVDRGPASKDVLDLLMGWSLPCERRFLCGNHEQAMLGFLNDPVALRAWLRHGGRETLQAFAVHPPNLEAGPEGLIAAAAQLNEALGKERRGFLENLERCATYGDYYFAHAGINPNKPLDEQEELDLYWIREAFLKAHRKSGPVVVHGHTPYEEPLIGPRRIGLDTGAYATGRLTVARFEAEHVAFEAITPETPMFKAPG